MFLRIFPALPCVLLMLGLHTSQSLFGAEKVPGLSPQDYSFGYWENGMRKHAEDHSPDVLCLETGYYGFALDLAQLRTPRFGKFSDALDYTEALGAGLTRMAGLAPAELSIELESKGTVFRAVRGRGSLEPMKARVVRDFWMWESGRLGQHYEIKGLEFEDAMGRKLGVNGNLRLVAWPQSLTLTADIAPSHQYVEGWHEGVVGSGLCVMDEPWKQAHDPRLESAEMTVETWVKFPGALAAMPRGTILAKNGHIGTPGHFSFTIRDWRVTTEMNVASGVEARRKIGQRGRSLEPDVWYHLALSYDGKAMRFYLNGALQGTEQVDLPRRVGKGSLQLGAGTHSRSTLKAVYDQVRIWSRALSDAEIKAHAKNPEHERSGEALRFEQTFEDASVAAIQAPVWSDVTLRVNLKTENGEWNKERIIPGEWELNKAEQLSLQCELDPQVAARKAIKVSVRTEKDGPHGVRYDAAYNAYVAEIKKMKRDWPGGYNPIRNYDEFEIVVNNPGAGTVAVPFLLDHYRVANITGLVPILCDANGAPTGIPVQLSKNWHYSKLGSYLRAYALIPATSGTTRYRLRIPYGFYGSLPSASHAQLSLVGYGGEGRWDQLAIGCWGETICFDSDMSLTDVAVTDVRMLMSRNGREGTKWSWTDAGWGGDWFCAYNGKKKKLLHKEMKTAYLAHGPCLTEVLYDGKYGAAGEVDIAAKVQTLRTDDYKRTFLTFRYTFNETVDAQKGWLFKMGRTHAAIVPQVAYGNAAGLVYNESVPSTLIKDSVYLDRVELEGEAPWWVGFPGGRLSGNRNWGTGSRAWVIRSYQASFGGQVYTRPSVTAPVLRTGKDGISLDLHLSPPAGITQYLPGDTVEMEIEWMNFHREADDYYGPNEHYRQHLTEHPRSWRTIYREAAGNDLKVQVEGGKVLHRYPLIIEAEAPVVRLELEGGVGAVPVRFEGLESPLGFRLYQIIDGVAQAFEPAVHGNDYWQTDYHAKSGTYRITFNLPLDGLPVSTWELRPAVAP
jgi:hypothetical protein